MNDLLNKKCVPCEGGVLPFDISEIHKYQKKVDGWNIIKSEKEKFFLNKKFNFENFLESQEFVNKVGIISEEEGHHPDILFGWGYAEIKITTHAIEGLSENDFILAANETTVGVGSGQPSRLDSCQIAIKKMKKFINPNHEIVAASDAFFPFVDGIEKLIQNGVTAIIQPSGSIKDKDIIKFANDTNTALVFSKTRHFKH